MTSSILKRALAASAALMLAGTGAMAQDDLGKPDDFPQRPISLIVMYPAGGAVDVTARTFAQVAEQLLGHDFRVENRVGGAGMVGHTYLAKAAEADGYTVGVIANPFLFTDILLRNADFAKEEFDPIATISFDPVIWTVNASSELGELDFDGIIETAGENTLQVGMNPNSMFLFVSEVIERAREVEFNFIPFDGGRQGVTALLAGDIDATSAFYTEIGQYVEAGDLKAVAVTGDERHPMLPDTPTLSELDVPATGRTWGATRFFILPDDAPEDRRAYLERAFMHVLESEELAAAFERAGLNLNPAGAEETLADYEQTYEALEAFLTETGRMGN